MYHNDGWFLVRNKTVRTSMCDCNCSDDATSSNSFTVFFFLIISYHCWSFGLRGFTSRIFPKKIIIRCISQMSLELVKSRDITTKPSAITRTFHSRTSTKLRGKLVPRNIIKVCTQTQSYRGPKRTTIIPDVPLGDSFNFITMATRLSILVIVNVTKGESVT